MSLNSFYLYYKMKIFINNIDVRNIEQKINNLEPIYNYFNYREIYTNTSNFIIDNNKIFKLNINDYNSENIIYNNLQLFVDKSELKKTEVSSIPFNHIERDILVKKINYNNDKEISLIIKYFNNKIIDFYFETVDKNLDEYLKNKLFNFITLLFEIS
mgnify:FL=1